MKFKPEDDGETHYNIYSKGKTEYGRLLSNFAHTPFTCEDGYFASVEAYWYYLLTNNPKKENLRSLHGFAAKKLGRELTMNLDWDEEDWFKTKIFNALRAKVDQNPSLKYLLATVKWLPFTHYYVYNGKVIEPKDGKWLLDYWAVLKYQVEIACTLTIN